MTLEQLNKAIDAMQTYEPNDRIAVGACIITGLNVTPAKKLQLLEELIDTTLS